MKEEKEGSPLPCCMDAVKRIELHKGGIEWERK